MCLLVCFDFLVVVCGWFSGCSFGWIFDLGIGCFGLVVTVLLPLVFDFWRGGFGVLLICVCGW